MSMTLDSGRRINSKQEAVIDAAFKYCDARWKHHDLFAELVLKPGKAVGDLNAVESNRLLQANADREKKENELLRAARRLRRL